MSTQTLRDLERERERGELLSIQTVRERGREVTSCLVNANLERPWEKLSRLEKLFEPVRYERTKMKVQPNL